jgi:hypothetical protein
LKTKLSAALIIAFLIALAISGLWLAGVASGQSSFKISGYILDSNGHGIEGAQIIFGVPSIVPSVYSDSSGHYVISAPAGTYHINVWPPFDSSFIYYDQPVFVVGSDINKNITLLSGYKVSGYILDPVGRPISGAVVSLNGFFSGWWSNDLGYYFVSAPAGTYKLSVAPRSGYTHFYSYFEYNFVVNGNLSKNITVKETGTVYILADGSIDPASVPIVRLDDVYTLAGNIINTPLVIQRDNIVIDGAGFALSHSVSDFNAASSTTGVSIVGSSNVTLKNMGIYQWGDCIDVANSTNLTIENNSLSNVGFGIGMMFINSTNIKILGNTIRSLAALDRQTRGITEYKGSSNFTILENNIIGQYWGVLGFTRSVFSKNNVSLCYALGVGVGDFNEVFGNNFFNAGRIVGQVQALGTALRVGSNNSVYANDFVGNAEAFSLGSDNLVYANNFTGNGVGVGLGEASGNVFYGNNFVGSQLHDVDLDWDTSLPNAWDNGTYGNYWSNYKYALPNATEVDDTGTGSLVYGLSPNNTDHHPLLKPISVEQAIAITPPQPTSQFTEQPEQLLKTWIVTITTIAAIIIAAGIIAYLVKKRKAK